MNSHAPSLESLESSESQPSQETAPVSGFARSFLTYEPIPDAKITILETGKEFNTDGNGRFGPFQYPVGEDITLILEKKGFHTTQSATLTVPPEGLTGIHHEISFQVPSDFAYKLFEYTLWVKVDENACQITAALTAHKKTMADIPQGEPGAVGKLTPEVNIKPFYFGIFESGPLKDKTNPLQHNLTSSSFDGGIGYLNLPPRDEPYKLTAVKAGVTFNEVKFKARKGAFINISPPHGPMVQREDNNDPQVQENAGEMTNKIENKPPSANRGYSRFGLFALGLAGTVVATAGATVCKHLYSPK